MSDDLRSHLKLLPLAPAALQMPLVNPPSLDGISVSVRPPGPLTEQELSRRFYRLAREHAIRRLREPGEILDLGDDVQLDVFGFADEQLIPFSVRLNWWTTLSSQYMPPDLCEGIVGMEVDGVRAVGFTLPSDYAAEALRGKDALFTVKVLSAFATEVPDFKDPAFVARLGRGSSLEQVMESLAQEYKEELTQELLSEARTRVLSEVAARTQTTVSQEWIDEEIRRHWEAGEGNLIAQKGFPSELREAALSCWRKDPATRRDVEERLRLGLGLRALSIRDKLELKRENVDQLLQPVAEQLGLKLDAVREVLRSNPTDANDVVQVAAHFLAVSHVMSQATVIWPS